MDHFTHGIGSLKNGWNWFQGSVPLKPYGWLVSLWFPIPSGYD